MVWYFAATFVGGVVFWYLLGNPILRGIAKAFHSAGDFMDRQ